MPFVQTDDVTTMLVPLLLPWFSVPQMILIQRSGELPIALSILKHL